MNKFVLILPLLMLAVFLGYCGSGLPREWVYAAIIVTVIVVAIMGYFLLLENKKAGKGKTKKKALTTAFISVLLFSALAGGQMVNLVGANFKPVGHGVKPPDAYTKPPTITITSPENYTLYNMNWVSLTFNVSVGESTTASYTWIHELWYKVDWQENKTYVDLEVYYSDGETRATPRERNSTLLPEFSFNLTDIPEGEHSITVYANEKGQYYSQIWHYWNFFINSSSSVNFTIDSVPPEISVLQPMNKTYATSEVPLNFTVSEQTEWISYSLDGQTNVTVTGNTTLSGVPDGSHSLVVYAKDTAGYIGISEPFYFTVDTTAPAISLLTTENKTYDTTDIPLNVTVNEQVSQITYALDGQANVTITGNTTLTGLSEGSHNLTIYAEDMVGNIGASETVYFSIIQEAEPIFSGLSLPLEYGYPLIAGIVTAAAIFTTIVAMAGYLSLKRRKRDEEE